MDFPSFSYGSRGSRTPLGGLVVILWFFGGAAFLGGAGLAGYRLYSVMQSEAVAGRVVDVRHNAGDEAAPIVAYEVGGEYYEHESEEFFSADFSIGEELEIRYRPGDPEDARIVTFRGTWAKPLTLAALGAFFFVTGLVMFRRRVPVVTPGER